MKKEQIKSLVLTGLVILSVVLFWRLVTFQENADFIKDPNYVEKINIGQKREMKDLILPNKLISRTGESEFIGTENLAEILKVLTEIRQFKFYEFQLDTVEFQERLNNHSTGDTLFFQFPDHIPFELITSLFTVETAKVPSGEFKYLYIFADGLDDEEGVVFFASADLHTAVKARVRYNDLSNFQKAYNEFVQDAHPYLVYEKKNGTYLYIMDKELLKSLRYYYPSEYDPELFKKALFSDPDLVNRNGNRYTDGSSLLDFYPETKMLSFVDTTISLETPLSLYELIQESVDYINEHSGWTDRYYLYTGSQDENEAVFQLYLQDYPVFHENGLSQIAVTASKKGVYSYNRPYFNLNISINPSENEILMPAGSLVLEEMEQSDRINMEKVMDVVIGYQLSKDKESSLLIFEPEWYYRLGDRWIKVNENGESGGADNGLE